MSSIRLFILGALERRGPMHGHQIRRNAEQDRTERWTDFKVGSVYGALNRLAREGLIEVHATEQEGNMPARTVYRITEDGRHEFDRIRRATLEQFSLLPDPVDLALQYSAHLPPEELRGALQERQMLIAAQLDSWNDLIAFAEPHLKGLEPVIVRHTKVRLEAELRWHEDMLAVIDDAEAEAGKE